MSNKSEAYRLMRREPSRRPPLLIKTTSPRVEQPLQPLTITRAKSNRSLTGKRWIEEISWLTKEDLLGSTSQESTNITPGNWYHFLQVMYSYIISKLQVTARV